MVDKRVIARERSDQSNLAQITGLLRLRLSMTASDFSIIVKNIAFFQQSPFDIHLTFGLWYLDFFSRK